MLQRINLGSVAMVLIALCGCSAQEKVGRFRYEQQIGMASVNGTEGCLAIINPSIKPGTMITLADQPGEHFINDATPIVETATVVELLPKDCDNSKMTTNEFGIAPTYYRIRVDKEFKGNIYVFAIIPPSGPLTTSGKAIEGDLDEDGTKESFRACSSREGIHYQVWTGPPLTGQPRWHWYVYLGYDVDPSCTEKEYFGPR